MIAHNRKDIKSVLEALDSRSQELYIVESTYCGNKRKATFVDLKYGEFKAIPYRIIRGSSHPQRAKEKRIKTNTEKYGGPSPFCFKDTHVKSESTMLKKYGVSKPLQNQNFKDKFKATSNFKFGCDHPFQSAEIKDKINSTNLEKYGVDNFFKTFTKYFVDGESFASICIRKGVPKSFATAICKEHGLEKGLEYVLSYDGSSTDIETEFALNFTLAQRVNAFPSPDVRYKVDFQIGEKSYVETDGLYWHSEVNQKDRKYHFKKRLAFESKELRLFQFRADEIFNKMNIIQSILNNNLGLSTRIYARNTNLKEVTNKQAKDFLMSNHLMGYIKSKHLGLFLKEELVAIISYSIGKVLKIDRFCSKNGTTVIGGFEKLLSKLPKNLDCQYWVDLRYGTGKHLESRGFKHSRDTLGWKWTDFSKTYNRRSCRANMDDRKLSERQHAEELGLVKIYDAGQRLYVRYADQ